MTMSVKSKGTGTRMSDGVSGLQPRRAAALRSLWTHNDHVMCKIIAQLAKSRIQIFTYNIQVEQKKKMKGRVIEFVTGFI